MSVVKETRDKFGARPVPPFKALYEQDIPPGGRVALLATYGSDELIADAARISYGRRDVENKDPEPLIRYLLRNRHTSPFEQAEATFFLRLPIFVARQLIRHRTANVNEYSARYTEMKDDFYVPSVIEKQSTTNKQGGAQTVVNPPFCQSVMEFSQSLSMSDYKSLLQSGVSREQARIVVPLGAYTEMYWKCDIHNLMHFFRLRLDTHAQREIREFAWAMFAAVAPYFPATFSAFEDYIRCAKTLSQTEIYLLKCMFVGTDLVAPPKPHDMSDREYAEFQTFITSLTI
jgi:thymidylate synthase (FAD)